MPAIGLPEFLPEPKSPVRGGVTLGESTPCEGEAVFVGKPVGSGDKPGRDGAAVKFCGVLVAVGVGVSETGMRVGSAEKFTSL